MGTFADIHSHVLQSVDDGSPDEATAVFTLKKMEKLGTECVVLTPHYCKRRGYVASQEIIKREYDRLCEACVRENIGIKLYLGTELEYSTDTVRYIREGRVNTLADTKYILVEFPPYVSSSTIFKACTQIMQTGLVPIIAHVERYASVYKEPELLFSLKDMGIKFQVNIRSVCMAGFKTRRFLKMLFQEQLADFLAGDVHIDAITKKEADKCKKFVLRYASLRYYRKLIYENAKNILSGGQI